MVGLLVPVFQIGLKVPALLQEESVASLTLHILHFGPRVVPCPASDAKRRSPMPPAGRLQGLGF